MDDADRHPAPRRLLHAWRRRLQALAAAAVRRRPAAGPPDSGRWGELQAAAFLRRQGFAILGCRVRPNRHDEIDLVAQHGDTLVFVEVKTRGSEFFGRPAAAVDRRKRHRLCRAAACYLRRTGYPGRYYRFDVVEVVGRPGGAPPLIRHLADAFRLETRYRFPRKA